MLNSEIIKKIETFVSQKPRSIQEIASHISKNWRTADRYIAEIEKEYGTISTRVFRGGTRGALKIVYWASIEKVSSFVFQQHLENEILSGRTKFDFSPFDIFQFVDNKKKSALILKGTDETSIGLENLKSLLLSPKKQLLIFSGNLSFTNFKDNIIDACKLIESIVKKGISIKIVCRVDLVGKENIEKLLSLNLKYGKEKIEIRHREQPLRAIIVDNSLISIKEIKIPDRKEELKEKTFIFYTIKDKEWIEWLSRIFWKMFSSSIDSSKRLIELNNIIKTQN